MMVAAGGFDGHGASGRVKAALHSGANGARTMIYKWVPGQGRPNGKTWKTKPAVECFGETPVKIQFRFETVWMKMHDSRFVGGDNKRITTAALVVSDDVRL